MCPKKRETGSKIKRKLLEKKGEADLRNAIKSQRDAPKYLKAILSDYSYARRVAKSYNLTIEEVRRIASMELSR